MQFLIDIWKKNKISNVRVSDFYNPTIICTLEIQWSAKRLAITAILADVYKQRSFLLHNSMSSIITNKKPREGIILSYFYIIAFT